MQLNKPKKLMKGDKIAVVSPSFGGVGMFPHRVEAAKNFFEKEGYRLVFMQHSRDNESHVSADAQARAQDINDAFRDQEISAIICGIGGNHSSQILKYLDWEVIKSNPKIFVGYSDISVLHYAFIVEAKLETYYGPCLITQFGEFPNPLEYTLNYFNKVLIQDLSSVDVEASREFTSEVLNWVTKSDLERPRKLIQSQGHKWLRGGVVQAPIIGGCVPSINHLIGTKNWIDPIDNIFFIDIPEGHVFGEGLSISELDSYLSDLDNIGVFNRIKGLVIGRPYNYSKDQERELEECILKYTSNQTYPILTQVNIGHVDPIITLPLMRNVMLNSVENVFTIM